MRLHACGQRLILKLPSRTLDQAQDSPPMPSTEPLAVATSVDRASAVMHQ